MDVIALIFLIIVDTPDIINDSFSEICFFLQSFQAFFFFFFF